jgi:hypothetical protein
MTPKEQAIDIISQMNNASATITLSEWDGAPAWMKFELKRKGLVVVNTILKEYKRIAVPYVADKSYVIDIEYWQEVKQEIEKL